MGAAGAWLRHGQALAETLNPNLARMWAALDAEGGVVMAETASFLLAARMPCKQAQAVVRQAVHAVRRGPETLVEALARLAPEGIDWRTALNLASNIAAAEEAERRVFASARLTSQGADRRER